MVSFNSYKDRGQSNIDVLFDRLLYDMHSPRTSGGRGMAFGRIYSRDGTLIATTAQEGILRLSKREQEKRSQQIPGDSKL
jgi:hypothetical protein